MKKTTKKATPLKDSGSSNVTTKDLQVQLDNQSKLIEKLHANNQYLMNVVAEYQALGRAVTGVEARMRQDMAPKGK